MKTAELIAIIGEPTGALIIKDQFGNATLHKNGWWTCDPCYLPKDLTEAFNTAHSSEYPWEGRNYKQHNEEWMPFSVQGHQCYARSCSDGIGFFGNCVDAGWVAAFPFDLAPQFMRDQVNVIEQPAADRAELNARN